MKIFYIFELILKMNSELEKISKPLLVRQLTSTKWDYAKNYYDNYMNGTIKNTIENNNYIDENGCYFLWVSDFNRYKYPSAILVNTKDEMNNILDITKHYLIKINDDFFQVVFNIIYGQEHPIIKSVSQDEYLLFQNDECTKGEYTVLKEKQIVDNIINQQLYYFIIEYKYKIDEKCPSCHISYNIL